MSFTHHARASSTFPNCRQAVAIRPKVRHTTSAFPRMLLRDSPGSVISQSSARGERASSPFAPPSGSVRYTQGCRLKASNGESEGHRPRLPEVRLEDRIDVFQYQHNDDPLGQKQTGTIALNLLKELPDTVVRDPASGLLSVKLDKLLAYTLEGIENAGMALKDLDTKQPLGLCILMQQQSVTTSENSNPSLLPAHTALVAFSKTDHEPSVPASNLVSSTPPDASSHLGPSPLEIQPPSPLSYTSFETDATMIQHVMLGLGEDPDDPEVQDQMGKLVQQLGPAHVWDAFLEAQHTSLLKQDGTKRSPGGTFFTLLKKRRQTSKLRHTEKQEASRVHTSLHDYQKRLLECVGKGGNHIIVAPTGSDKTRVAVELAGLILGRKPTAHILFLTQTVALAEQQTGAFRAAQSIPYTCGVECFSSENPISAYLWPSVLDHTHVLVMTAQVFLNLLDTGDASLDAFDLMVFDECHHTQKNNPFNKIALKYTQLTAQQQAHLQVLGLTATPAVAPSLTETHAQLDSLRSNMRASFLVVPSDDAEVRRVVGETHEIMRQVGSRPEDVSVAMDLGRVLLDHVECFAQHDLTAQGVLAEISSSLLVGKGSGRLTGLLSTLSIDCPDHLIPNLQLLQSCNTALDLNKDTGFELPMRLLARTCVAIKSPASQLDMPISSSSPASQMPTKEGAATVSSTLEISETTAASMMQALMQDLATKVYNLKLSLDAMAAGQSGAVAKFPKFQELVTVLREMKDKKGAWHSIVFVKDRQSVHAIAAMLQEAPQLANIGFFTFTGRPNSNKRLTLPGAAQSSGVASDGMKLHQQKNALLNFKEAEGMAVLVSTAAEEGLDIVNCELVVSYTMVETGREMIQKRGRARMAGSQFVSIVEEHDQARLEMAQLAEHYARVAQMQN